MIRENMYLFRGRRMRDNKWIYGNFRYNPTENLAWISVPKGLYEAIDAVYPDTVGQYTGLTDKNGKQIFEGDILLFYFEEIGPQKAVVEWSQKYMMFKLSPTGNFQYARPVDGEVIWNIYDNPPEGDSHA